MSLTYPIVMRSLVLVALAALSGCGTYAYPLATDNARSRQRLTEQAVDRTVTVRVQGQMGVQAQALSIRADSTSWTDPASGATQTVATDRLRGVVIPGSDKSAFKTVALGVTGGLLTGAALGYVSYEFPNSFIGSREEATAFGSAGAALIGGLVGLSVARDRQSDNVFVVRNSGVNR